MVERFLIYGHRGSPLRFPENTIASFEETLRAGADGFETDVRLLCDGTPVLVHDNELGDSEIETLTMLQCAERGALVDRLSNLSRFSGRATMILEVKRRGWEETLIEQIAGWSGIVVASFDHSVIDELHRRNVPFPLGITIAGYLVDAASYAARLGATWFFPKYQYVDAEMVAALDDHGIRVIPWTPNRKHEWERLREIGCGGVITDDPAAAVAWRDSI